MRIRRTRIGGYQDAEDWRDQESRSWEFEIERYQWDETTNENLFNLVLGLKISGKKNIIRYASG